MEYLAKKSFSFLQDSAFISINIETCTNKWNISRKSRFLFLQDFAFTSMNNETCTNKWNISRKSRFLFCKILHLLVTRVNLFPECQIVFGVQNWPSIKHRYRFLYLINRSCRASVLILQKRPLSSIITYKDCIFLLLRTSLVLIKYEKCD